MFRQINKSLFPGEWDSISTAKQCIVPRRNKIIYREINKLIFLGEQGTIYVDN